MEHHVFLLRGIGPATHKVMTMSALEAACHVQGLGGTKNLLATGNLVVSSDLALVEVEARFAAAMALGGLQVTWQRRAGGAIKSTIAAVRALAQMAQALAERPSRVQLHFLPGEVSDTALDSLRAFAPGSLIVRAGGELVIDYGASIGQSPLTVSRLDKALGRANTGRNWNTMRKIAALL